MSYLKGVQRLMLMLSFRSFTFEPFPQSSHLCDTDRWKALSIFAAINRSPIVTSGVSRGRSCSSYTVPYDYDARVRANSAVKSGTMIVCSTEVMPLASLLINCTFPVPVMVI